MTEKLLTPSQQAAGEAAYLRASKRESAVANYPAIVAAIGEAVMAQYWADLRPDKVKSRQDLCALVMALPIGWEVTVCTDWKMPEIVGFCNTGDIQEIKQYLEIRIDGPSIVREINSMPFKRGRGGE